MKYFVIKKRREQNLFECVYKINVSSVAYTKYRTLFLWLNSNVGIAYLTLEMSQI